MFCFQCEQTAKGTGCTLQQGVCGKKADTADLQDKLTSAVIKLANCYEPTEEHTELILDGLFTTVTNVSFDNRSIGDMQKIFSKKQGVTRILTFNPCGIAKKISEV